MGSFSNNGNSEAKQIRFLSDQPLDADKEREMRFGHLSIVDNLKVLILNCPTPFTIGLFGKWGTGKTTILDALKRRLRATGIAVIKIDAWKHEGDALRRTFLQDTISQLKEKQDEKQYLSTNVKLSENLIVPISRTFRGGIKPNWSLIWPLLIMLAVLLAVGFLIGALLPNNLGTYISTVLGGGLVAGIILWLLQQSVTTETVTTTTERFEDPHEFEEEFKKIVDKVVADKLLIIIDNLDRVSCEHAIELLSTIKTFLEQKKCVFLIACDAEAIKKHFERLYATDHDNIGDVSVIDGEEFLRKFFNSYIIIPEFIDTELQSYTEDLLRETNLSIDDSPDVALVIAKAFRDNPRQIKQFINTLLSHFLLAKTRESSWELPKGSVTNNVRYLAKFLVIRLQFPDYYDLIIGREAVNTSSKKLDDFLRATKPINVDDNRPFIYLKLSEEEIEVPEIRDLQFAIQDNNVDLTKQIIGGMQTDTRKLNVLNKFVSNFIDRNRGRELLLFNVVSSTLSALQQLGMKIDKYFYFQVAELLHDDSQLGTHLQNFSPNIIFNELLGRCDDKQIEEIINRYSSLFSEPDQITREDRDSYTKELLKEFIEHKNWLNAIKKQEIQSAITQKHCRFEVLSMFIGKIDEQKEFIHENTLSNFISAISDSDVEQPEQLREKSDLIIDFKRVVSDKNLSEIITQCTALLSTEASKPYRDEKDNLLACLDDVIYNFSDRIANLEPNMINAFVEQILKGINAMGPSAQKRIFIPICLRLEKVINGLTIPLKSQIVSVINTFFASASSDDLNFVFDKFRIKNDKEEVIIRYRNNFKQRVISDQNIFDLLYKLATKEIRTEWITGLIQANHQTAVAKLEQWGHHVDDKKAVVSEILTRVDQLPVAQRESLYITCNKMKCANDTQLKENFVSHIKILLKDTNPDAQKIGLTILHGATYLSQTQRRDITTETVEWLNSPQPNSSYQPSSAQVPLETWEYLTPVLKQKFMDFVFEKLIRRGISNQSIDLGFNILGRIKPKPEYSEYQAYFDDIFSRTESEPNTDVKSQLAKGLRSLAPGKLNKENKDFWEKVKQLPEPGNP